MVTAGPSAGPQAGVITACANPEPGPKARSAAHAAAAPSRIVTPTTWRRDTKVSSQLLAIKRETIGVLARLPRAVELVRVGHRAGVGGSRAAGEVHGEAERAIDLLPATENQRVRKVLQPVLMPRAGHRRSGDLQ